MASSSGSEKEALPSSPSVQQMEVNIKQMLNISGKNPLLESESGTGGRQKPSDKLR